MKQNSRINSLKLLLFIFFCTFSLLVIKCFGSLYSRHNIPSVPPHNKNSGSFTSFAFAPSPVTATQLNEKSTESISTSSSSLLNSENHEEKSSEIEEHASISSYGETYRDVKILNLPTMQNVADKHFPEFGKFIRSIGATFMIEQSREITIFMPTDEAMKDELNNINKLSWQEKWDIFNNLVIPGHVFKVEQMSEGEHSMESLLGEKITLRVPEDISKLPILINGEIQVLEGFENLNGISYKVDKLIIPSGIDLSSEGIKNYNEENKGDENIIKGEDTPNFLLETNAQHDQWNSVLQKKFSQKSDNLKKDNSDISDKINGKEDEVLIQKLSVEGEETDENNDKPSNFGWVSTQFGWGKHLELHEPTHNNMQMNKKSSIKIAAIRNDSDANTFDLSSSSSNTFESDSLKKGGISNKGPSDATGKAKDIKNENDRKDKTSLHDSIFHEHIAPIKTLGHTAGLLPQQELIAALYKNNFTSFLKSLSIKDEEELDTNSLEATKQVARKNIRYMNPLKLLSYSIYPSDNLD